MHTNERESIQKARSRKKNGAEARSAAGVINNLINNEVEACRREKDKPNLKYDYTSHDGNGVSSTFWPRKAISRSWTTWLIAGPPEQK